MRKIVFIWIAAIAMAMTMQAAEHVYTWGTEFPNYKSQMPSSDFTTADALFRFTTEKGQALLAEMNAEGEQAGNKIAKQ